MISTARFREILQSPDKIEEEDARGLDLLLEKFPWFAAPRILLAHYHQKEELYSFNRLLQQASVYVGDRKKLYEILHQDAVSIGQQEQDVVISTPVANEEHENSSIEKTSVLTELSNATEPAENVEYLPQIIPSTANPEEISGSEILENKPKEEAIDCDESSADQKENQAEIPVYDPLIALQAYISGNTDEGDPEKTELHPLLVSPVYDPEKELLKFLEEDSTPHEPEETETDAHDFLYWLDHPSTDNSEDTRQAERVRNKLKTEAPESTDLLEQFIKNRPQMKRPKTEFFKAETAALRSESLESPIVSESLAKLLVKQGHYMQAIEVYQKLSLQIPHRKSYFAARITEIDHLRNK